MLRTVVLHGYLAEEFGNTFHLDAQTPAEIMRALSVQLRGFASRVRAGEFFVVRGEEKIEETGLIMTLGSCAELHIVPVANGSKNNGVLKVILGVVLIGVGFAVAGAFSGGAMNMGATLLGMSAKTFITLGAGMFLNGLGQMLSPTPTVDSNESADARPSYLFSGALNLSEEGNVIPVAYGAPWCGSLVASSGMDTKEVK